MTDLRKAAEQALEALENASDIMDSWAQKRQDDAITALKAALAEPVQEPVQDDLIPPDSLFVCGQMGANVTRVRLAEPVQEPVACKTLCELCVKRGYTFCANAVKTTPINTPPQRKPLTDEEIERACVPLGAAMLSFTEVARAIEAAHGIKE